jgi:hypothetical protein
MSGNDTVKPDSAVDGADWSRAWQAVAKLATAWESLQEIPRAHSFLQPEHADDAGSDAAIASAEPGLSVEHDQLATALAEIEQASAALRRSEPLLEHGLPAPASRNHQRTYRSVWILIAAIWISATVVVATATGAILYILG